MYYEYNLTVQNLGTLSSSSLDFLVELGWIQTAGLNLPAEFLLSLAMSGRVHTYSNAFLWRFSASTRCFCTKKSTILLPLTYRAIQHLCFYLLFLTPGIYTTWGIKILKKIK